MNVTVSTQPHFSQAKPNFVTLPGKWGKDEDGNKVPITFIDGSGTHGDLTIPPSGLEWNTAVEDDAHNLDALTKLLRLKPYWAGFSIKVVNGQEQATDAIALREQKFQAYSALKPRLSDGPFCTSLARRLGYAAVDKASADEVQNWLEDFAETQPLKLMQLLNDQTKHLKFLLTDALAVNLLRYTGGFYVYHGKPLGATEDEVIVTFHKHPEYVYQLESELGRSAGAAVAEIGASPYKPDSFSPPQVPASSSVSAAGGSVGAGSTNEQAGDELPKQTPEQKLEQEVWDIVAEALSRGVLVEDTDGEGKSLYYDGNALSMAGTTGSPVDRAVALLAKPVNKALRTEIKKASKP